MGAVLNIAAGVLDLIFPRGCACCDEPIAEAGVPMCARCSATLATLVAPDYCGCCGKDVGPYLLRDGRCNDCQTRRPPFERFVRIGRYRSVLRDLVLRLKYRGAPTLDALLGDMLADMAAATPGFDAVDAWVPVPSARVRTLRRRYQPTWLLSERLAHRTGRPCLRLLVLARTIKEQKTLPDDQRAANVRGAFRVPRGSELRGATVGLVDDVFTSGSTLREAARTLRAAGAARVLGIVVATANVGQDAF